MSGVTRKVLRILNEDTVGKINFRFGGLRISGDDLRRVGRAIDTGAIGVVHYPSLESHAAYYPGKNTFVLKSEAMGDRYERTHRSMAERSFVVHEATHAVVDMKRATGTRVLANEAAAYLAQALYLYQEMGEISYAHYIDRGAFNQDIHRACLSVIKKHNLANREKQLSDSDYKPIMQAIKKNPQYADTPWTQLEGTDADGVARPQSQAAPRLGGCSMRPATVPSRVRLPQGIQIGEASTDPAAQLPPLRARFSGTPTPQWLKTLTTAPAPQRRRTIQDVHQNIHQQLTRRADPYSGEIRRALARIRPAQRTQWMKTHRPQAYQEHLNNVRLLRETVSRQLTQRTDPYSTAMWRDVSRIRPAQRTQWMKTYHPQAYQQHLNNVRLLRDAVNRQLR